LEKYTKGEIEFKFDDKNRIGIAMIKDFIIYSVHARYLEGYFYQIMCLMVSPENLKVERIKGKDPDVHQFRITW